LTAGSIACDVQPMLAVTDDLGQITSDLTGALRHIGPNQRRRRPGSPRASGSRSSHPSGSGRSVQKTGGICLAQSWPPAPPKPYHVRLPEARVTYRFQRVSSGAKCTYFRAAVDRACGRGVRSRQSGSAMNPRRARFLRASLDPPCMWRRSSRGWSSIAWRRGTRVGAGAPQLTRLAGRSSRQVW
jgi:hypothetical protein